MTKIFDTVIVGGSLTGASLGLALARAGLDVCVIDALPKDTQTDRDFDGRSYALALASVRLLKALDLWGAMADDAQPMLHIKVSDGRAGEGPSRFALHFDCGELEEGPMGHMVEDRHLRRALLDALETTPGVTHLPDTRVAAQSTDGDLAEVTLENGQTLQARLLVGADGRTGPVAARAGISRQVTDYRQTALVCAIQHEKPHGGTAHQLFMPPGPLAILPLKGNRSSIVWSETADQAAAIHALSDEDYLAVLRPRFGDFLGEISLEGQRYTYPLSLVLADRYAAPRLVLVGDSAHGMHPIAGQGFNAGLRDVGALAEVLVEARRRGEDIGRSDVLDRYVQWRRFDVASMAVTTDTINRLFSNDNPLLRLGRDLGLGFVNSTPPLRRAFMREAAGLTGDLPRLMRGEPL